jgi:hypothetical protein
MIKTILSICLILVSLPTLNAQLRRKNPKFDQCVAEFKKVQPDFQVLSISLDQPTEVAQAFQVIVPKLTDVVETCNVKLPVFPTQAGTAEDCTKDIEIIRPRLLQLSNAVSDSVPLVQTYIQLIGAYSAFVTSFQVTVADCSALANNNN